MDIEVIEELLNDEYKDEELNEDELIEESISKIPKYRRYTISDKLIIIKDAKLIGNHATTKKWDINEGAIRYIKKKKKIIKI